MVLSLIAALTKNYVIGRHNRLPWHLPADLKHFKTITTHKVVVMGRKTYEGLGQALPQRTNVVVTRNPLYQSPDALVLPSLDAVINTFQRESEVIIIGGAELFMQALPRVQRMYLTIIATELAGDAYFPTWNQQQWQEVSRVDHLPDNRHAYAYSFRELHKLSESAN